MDLPTFRNRFGEFVGTEDGPILACLAAAAPFVNADEWGALYDEVHGLTAAHKVALSPFGTAARMVTVTDATGAVQTRTSYEVELARLIKGGMFSLCLAGRTCYPAGDFGPPDSSCC